MQLDIKDASRITSISLLVQVGHFDYANELTNKMSGKGHKIGKAIIQLANKANDEKFEPRILKVAESFAKWAKTHIANNYPPVRIGHR